MHFYYFIWFSAVLITLLYVVVILRFLSGWHLLKVFKLSSNPLKTSVTVLVPFYNEQQNLAKCIESIVHQQIDTAHIQIILINDKSTDNSLQIARKMAETHKQLLIIDNTTLQKGKKQSLTLGLQHAMGELIVTTDADCVHDKNWLHAFVEYFEKFKPQMILGPVQMTGGVPWFQKFQELEFMSLMGSTAGAAGIGRPIMCNAANMAYTKQAYLEFSDPFNMDYISGDDLFLMHQIKDKYPGSVHYLKSAEALVTISPSGNLKEFMKQRFRWVSKTPGYTDGDTLFTAGIVFITALLMTTALVGTAFHFEFYKPLLFIFVLKTASDLMLLYPVSKFFNKRNLTMYLPVLQPIYAFYVVITVFSLLFIRKRKG